MLNLDESDVLFLKELAEELRTQEHDCQAEPRFWALRDYQDVESSIDNCEKKELYYDTELYSLEDAKEYLIDIGYENELKDFLNNYGEVDYDYFSDDDEFLEFFNNKAKYDAYWIYTKSEPVILPNTMFLTKQEAKDHIRLNHYHYTDKVHTYAMTAWRAPKVDRLLKILEKIK